jgi:hypothetical protein
MNNQELDKLAKRFKGAKARAVRAGLIPIDQVRAEIAERDRKIAAAEAAMPATPEELKHYRKV